MDLGYHKTCLQFTVFFELTLSKKSTNLLYGVSQWEKGRVIVQCNNPLFNFFIHLLFLQQLPLAIAEALWDHTSLNSDELAFSSGDVITVLYMEDGTSWWWGTRNIIDEKTAVVNGSNSDDSDGEGKVNNCLLYTSPSPRDKRQSRMPSSA